MCVAYLPDLIIDYPNASLYANEMMEKAVEYKIMTLVEAEKYKQHISTLGDEGDISAEE